MLGFVPQPNLRSLRFLALTEPYCHIKYWFAIALQSLVNASAYIVNATAALLMHRFTL